MPPRKTQYNRKPAAALGKRTRGRPRGSGKRVQIAAEPTYVDEPADEANTRFAFADDEPADTKKTQNNADGESFWSWLGF